MCRDKYVEVIKVLSGRRRKSEMPTLTRATEKLTKTARFNFLEILESKLTKNREMVKQDCWILIKVFCGILVYPVTISHTPVWQRFGIAGHIPSAGCWYKKQQYGLSQRIVIVCLDLAYGSLKNWLRCLTLFCLSQNFPRTEVALWAVFTKKIWRQIY